MAGRSGLAILEITDGTNTVNLLAMKNGFGLKDWRPLLAPLRGGGTFHEGPFVNGRRLVDYRFENIVDTFDLTVNGDTQDFIIAQTRKLRQLLQKGRDYWTSRWQDQPVWIKARGSNETNARYAIVNDWSTPNDANPYATPFFKCDGDTLLNEFSLIVEHGMWQDVAPGSPSCIPVNSVDRVTSYLSFDGVDDYVSITRYADIDDLLVTSFTVDFWMRTSDQLAAGDHIPLVAKGGHDGSVGWAIYLDGTLGLTTIFHYSIADDYTYNGDITALTDGLWHHIAMAYDLGAGQWYIFLDGMDVSNFNSPGNGVYATDAAINLLIGKDTVGADTFHGDIGWVRINDANIFPSVFDPPSRLLLPPIHDTNVGAWIWEGAGSTIINIGGVGNAATVYGATWVDNAGNIGYTDANHVSVDNCNFTGAYVANKHTLVQLTHMYYMDATFATFYENVMTSPLPKQLLPNNFDVNDILYIGVATDTPPAGIYSGPFSSVVFNLAGGSTAFTGTWEYWNGAAWAALTDYINDESGLKTGGTGLGILTIAPPSNWTYNTVNGVQAYWVRLILTSAGATPPQQATIYPYTVTWPCITVPAASTGGDLPSPMMLATLSKSSRSVGVGEERNVASVFVGLRSTSRGADFSSYINISDRGILQGFPNFGLSIAPGSHSSAVTSILSPYGRCFQYSASVIETDNLELTGSFNYVVAPQYYGTFRLFLRGRGVSGAESEMSFRIRMTGAAGAIWYSDRLPWTNSQYHDLIDFGEVTIPWMPVKTSEVLTSLTLSILSTSTGTNAKVIDLWDIIMIPTDEWFMNIKVPPGQDGLPLNTYYEIDGVQYPKYPIRGYGKDASGRFAYSAIPNGSPPILQANAEQKLWFLCMATEASVSTLASFHDNVNAEKILGYKRYFSMRGSS